jgi:hypothetical protein
MAYAHKQVKIKSEKLTFGISKLIIVIGLILIGIALIEYTFYAVTLPESKRLTNLMRVYTLGIESYNCLVTLHQAYISLILWNNTV